jgi:hypothetical protein
MPSWEAMIKTYVIIQVIVHLVCIVTFFGIAPLIKLTGGLIDKILR